MFNSIAITHRLSYRVFKISRLMISESISLSSIKQDDVQSINNSFVSSNDSNNQKNYLSTITMKPIEKIIRDKITQTFDPFYYDVINESYKHNVSKDSESHFKIIIVSNKFNNNNLIQRHRLVNTLLHEELKTYIHALSIQAKTIEEWEKNPAIISTPNCLGGHK